jgi:ABC-2 type transport system ATP-binding protein
MMPRQTVEPVAAETPSTTVIVARSVLKSYRKSGTPALIDFDIEVKTGEFYGLLGANGAGKTTFISLCCGLLAQESGTVLVMGVEPRRHPRQVKKLIALVPQYIALYERLTASENLFFLGKMYGLGGVQLRTRVADCLAFVQLTRYAEQRVATYSSGMKRRLNLGAGLLAEPCILFLDEPTVGIDIQSRQAIYDNLRELNRCGTTIFYTTHYLKEAQELCSRIGIVNDGRLIDEGPPDLLLARNQSASLDELLLRLAGTGPDDG